MSKAVLMSIQPKWCELIASGKKTVEVRKTKPKIEAPFKVYIYCTRQKVNGEILLTHDKKVEGRNRGFRDEGDIPLAGKVIGEFVCDEIIVAELGSYCKIPLQAAQLDAYELMEYTDDKPVYGWHISNLIIYDKPKELREFYKYTEYDNSNNDIRPCNFCPHNKFDWSEMCEYCEIDFDGEHCIHLQMRRPPQSWCYVEEKVGADND